MRFSRTRLVLKLVESQRRAYRRADRAWKLYIDFDALHRGRVVFKRDFFAVLCETLEISADGIAHHGAGFLQAITFGYDPSKGRHREQVTAFSAGSKTAVYWYCGIRLTPWNFLRKSMVL